jgi:phage shock protein PspC (stress-responsive transcriptional regulator)
MNKVLTISLNGNAYQLDEAAYDKLRTYLDAARAKLAGNPDIEEIVRDLEQAVAEKIVRYRGAYKTVASLEDIEKVLGEMGPVDPAAEEGAATPPPIGPKRLYRLPDQKVIFGVCAGIAAYLNIDVTLVRVILAVLVIVTGGSFAIAYIAAMFILPPAKTPAERQAAYGGTPVTARDLIERTKKEYRDWDSSTWKKERKEWQRRWKEERKVWKHQGYAWQEYPRRGPSLIGEVAQVLFLGLVIYLLYIYVPQTDPFFDHVWLLIREGWSWIFAKLNTPVR